MSKCHIVGNLMHWLNFIKACSDTSAQVLGFSLNRGTYYIGLRVLEEDCFVLVQPST